jgi:hypothetical protein
MAGVRDPIEMVQGVPVVAAPEEIDASNADWLRAVLLEAGIDRLIPNFPSLNEALEPPPATAPRSPQPGRRAKPGMRTRPHRPPPDPGTSTSTG